MSLCRTARHAAAIVLCLGLAVAGWARAEDYPNRPIRLLVPAAPGGGADLLSRVVGQKLSQQLGVPIVVENRAGAAGVIASSALVNAAPDGYTMMMGYSGHATNTLFVKQLPYDSVKDFTPVVMAAYTPLMLVVKPSFPATSVRDLIALAKARPGQLQFASGGRGGGPFMAGLLFRNEAGIDLVHVPYNGNAPALNDVLAGNVTMMFDTINTSVPQVAAGRLKPLAVTSAKRSTLAPDVMTMSEAGLPGFEVYAWFVLMMPANVPDDIVRKMNVEFNRALAGPEIRQRLQESGVEPMGGSVEEAKKFVADEMAKWTKVIRESNLKDD